MTSNLIFSLIHFISSNFLTFFIIILLYNLNVWLCIWTPIHLYTLENWGVTWWLIVNYRASHRHGNWLTGRVRDSKKRKKSFYIFFFLVWNAIFRDYEWFYFVPQGPCHTYFFFFFISLFASPCHVHDENNCRCDFIIMSDCDKLLYNN